MTTTSRIMNQPQDYTDLHIDPRTIANWEDGRRDTDQPGHGEIWYFDCSFDDQSTLVLGFRPKSVAQVNQAGDNPNVAINYTAADGTKLDDYRAYTPAQATMATDHCELNFGPSQLTGDNWQTYDVHIEPEADQLVEMEGKRTTKHQTAADLRFVAQTQPFRPGSGYITFGDYYYNFICITKLTVTGTLTIDGVTKAVHGAAYYNHQWFNISPMTAFHHWLWGRQNIGKYSVLIYDMVAAEKFGLTQIPLFTIDDAQGHRLFENTDAANSEVEVLDSYVQASTGKRYPKKIRYTFTNDTTTVKYTITDPKEINVIDLFSQQPAAVQAQMTAQHLEPTYTRYLATSELELTQNGQTTTVTGPILYEFNYAGVENKDAHLF